MESQHWPVAELLDCPWGKQEECVVLPASNFSTGQTVQELNLLTKCPLLPRFPFGAISLVKSTTQRGREHSEILTYFPSPTSFYPIPTHLPALPSPPPHPQLATLSVYCLKIRSSWQKNMEWGRRRQSCLEFQGL